MGILSFIGIMIVVTVLVILIGWYKTLQYDPTTWGALSDEEQVESDEEQTLT